MEYGWSSFVCRQHQFCSVLEQGSSRKLESWISVCHSTMTVTANKVNLISKWFVLIVCSYLVENCVSILFGIGVSLSLDAMPGDLNLYVYLNIEMAIVLLQLIFFPVLPSRNLNQLSVVTVGIMLGGFCHSVVWSVTELSSFLLLVFGLFVIYILHYDFLHIFVNRAF